MWAVRVPGKGCSKEVRATGSGAPAHWETSKPFRYDPRCEDFSTFNGELTKDKQASSALALGTVDDDSTNFNYSVIYLDDKVVIYQIQSVMNCTRFGFTVVQ